MKEAPKGVDIVTELRRVAEALAHKMWRDLSLESGWNVEVRVEARGEKRWIVNRKDCDMKDRVGTRLFFNNRSELEEYLLGLLQEYGLGF